MRRWLLCLAAVLAAAAGLISACAAEGVTRCLLIGCDRFVSMPSTEPAGANNTEVMEALLRDFLPGETQITRRVNGPGGTDEFAELAEEAFRGAGEEDTALLYLSTHGILREEDGAERFALLLSDGDIEEELAPETLRRILDELPGKTVVILDACHSGAVIGCGTAKGTDDFTGSSSRVLVSAGAEEDSWFWSAEAEGYTGTGYFTAALDNALRASDPEQIDPDGDGRVSLKELTARLRDIHASSTVYASPDDSEEPLFFLPEDRKAGERLRGVAFGSPERDGDVMTLPIHFRAAEPVRVMYELVPSRNGRWDFEHAVRLPDREKTGLTRGLVSPGTKDRKIRMSVKSLGEDGLALMQIVTLRGTERIPAAEAGTVIRTVQGNLFPVQENPEE